MPVAGSCEAQRGRASDGLQGVGQEWRGDRGERLDERRDLGACKTVQPPPSRIRDGHQTGLAQTAKVEAGGRGGDGCGRREVPGRASLPPMSGRSGSGEFPCPSESGTSRTTFPGRRTSSEKAVGRVCAEQITPYPPGMPVLEPGERIGREALDYLLTGLRAGMVLPDPASPELETIRVVA